MERIAHSVNRESSDIKILNLSEKHSVVKDMIISFKADCEFETRAKQIQKYNEENCWKKRAIKFSAMSYPIREYYYYFWGLVERENGWYIRDVIRCRYGGLGLLLRTFYLHRLSKGRRKSVIVRTEASKLFYFLISSNNLYIYNIIKQ